MIRGRDERRERLTRPFGLTAVPAILVAIGVGAVMLAPAGDPVLDAASPAPGTALEIAAFSVSKDGSTATVQLAASRPIFATDASTPVSVKGNSVTIGLPFHADGDHQSVRVGVSDGVSSGELTIEFYPRTYYEAIGSSIPGTILLASDLPRAQEEVEVDPAVVAAPTAADLTYLRPDAWTIARSKGIVPPAGTRLDQAVLGLFTVFAEENDPSTRRLCPEQQPGIDQLNAVIAGSCYVWCTGLAKITRGFLRSAGIPTRVVQMVGDESTLADGTVVQSSEAHATVEWWNGREWVWLGPTSRALQATGPDGRPLSVAGLVDALANPAARGAIQVTRFDEARDAWATRPWAEQDEGFRSSLTRYFTADKTLRVALPPPPPLHPATGPLLLVAIGALLVTLAARLGRRLAGGLPSGLSPA